MVILESGKTLNNLKSGAPFVWKEELKKLETRWVHFNIMSLKEWVMKDHSQETIGGPRMLAFTNVYRVLPIFLCLIINTKVKVVTQRSGIIYWIQLILEEMC